MTSVSVGVLLHSWETNIENIVFEFLFVFTRTLHPPRPMVLSGNRSKMSTLCSVNGLLVVAGMVIKWALVQFGYNIEFTYFFGADKDETTSSELLLIYSLSFKLAFLLEGFKLIQFLSVLLQRLLTSNPPWLCPISSKCHLLYFFLAESTIFFPVLKRSVNVYAD